VTVLGRITVVIPTLDAVEWIADCLASVADQGAVRIIVVDGGSTDGTLELLSMTPVKVIRGPGPGPAAARQAGIRAARTPWIALIDADVLLPPDALENLFHEASERKLQGISAMAEHVSSGGYWSDQLVRHHSRARSRDWFGVSAALVRRSMLNEVPFDVRLASGEDIDLRLRLERAGRAVGTSRVVTVRHRYARGWRVAVGQWTADGAGLGRLVRKDGMAGLRWAQLPVAAVAIGIVRSVTDGFLTVPYYIGHLIGNLVGLIVGLTDRRVPFGRHGLLASVIAAATVWAIGVVSIVIPVLAIRLGIAVAPRMAQTSLESQLLPAATAAFVVLIVFREIDRAGRDARPSDSAIDRVLVIVGLIVGIAALLRLLAILGVLA
jgi:glycosyltransferase involved in cell wall biosynthesis